MKMEAHMEELTSRKFEVEIAKLVAETLKLVDESRKIQRETFWYPLVASAALFAAAVGFVKILL
jgi:hypothetical protein